MRFKCSCMSIEHSMGERMFTCQEKLSLPGHTDFSLGENRRELLPPPDPTFTAILQHFYRAFMTRSSAPVYTLRGRPWTEAAPATEQGSPRSGHVRVKRSGSGLSRSSGAI